MFTEYDRQQQARERAARSAQHIAARIEATPAEALGHSCDWDQELANLTAPPADADGPSPSDLHKPSHGGYPS